MRQSILDAILNMSGEHLSPDAPTVFERLEDAGLTAAAVNLTCYRGRTPHRTTIPGVTRSALGPKRFFFYNLFESDETGAPAAWREPLGGTIDEYAAAVGRWLVTRDGFDFFAFYLSDTTTSRMRTGPTRRGKESPASTARSGRSSRRRVAPTSFSSATPSSSAPIMDRRTSAAAQGCRTAFATSTASSSPPRTARAWSTASRTAGWTCPSSPRGSTGSPPSTSSLIATAIGRRPERGRGARGLNGAYPNAHRRLDAALRNPNAGEILVSAAARLRVRGPRRP